MIIEHLSERINHLKLEAGGIQYGNIEIRPKGIILHINQVFTLMLGPFRITI